MCKSIPRNERKVVFRTCIFMVGPLLAFTYSQLSIFSLHSLFAVGLSLSWVYLSIEDALRLSVPARALYLICTFSCIFAAWQQRPLWDYFVLACSLSSIFLIIWLIQALRAKNVIGFADFFALFSLGLTLKPDMLGPWLLIGCSIPLIGLLSKRGRQSTKVPFIPYLTVGWMLASTLS